LAGASLLVFANKQDLAGALTSMEIKQVRFLLSVGKGMMGKTGAGIG
jgi:hypothetical protein